MGVFLLGEGSRFSLLEAEEEFVERELPDEAVVLEEDEADLEDEAAVLADEEELLEDEERLLADEEGINFCSLCFSFIAG